MVHDVVLITHTQQISVNVKLWTDQTGLTFKVENEINRISKLSQNLYKVYF